MSKKEKVGSDGYSKAAFQDGLDKLDQSQIAYQSPSIQRNDSAEWRADVEGASPEDQKTIATLDRLHANATRMAENQELIAQIEKEKQELHASIARVSSVAPDGVIREAKDVERMGEKLSAALNSEKPHPRSFIEDLVREFLEAKKYILSKLRKWLGMQNRYGGDPSQPA